MMRFSALIPLKAAIFLVVAGCSEQSATDEAEAPVRGLITIEVAASEQTIRRRYPGVLEPVDITALSFEVAGRLGDLELSVGQRVSRDDVLAQLDSEQFEIEIQSRLASVEEARATLEQDREDLVRAEELLRRGAGTRVVRDQAQTDVKTNEARLRQAEEDLASARESLKDSVLRAPFDGIINSVDADAFATVSAGAAITSLYATEAYEVSFSVNFETVGDLVVGTPTRVRLADDPSIELAAVVSELGERADTVSSFPVVVELRETHPILKSGMAVEVGFELNLPAEQGFLIPITAAITEGQIDDAAGPRETSPLQVYVFDPETGTVGRRDVMMAGIRENKLLIIQGLNLGERVAVAGVSFLREGMPVRLVERDSRVGG